MQKAFSLVELSSRASGRACAERAGAQGFSLVELSIVLVILGLLTGGILAGQNLIRAAELRAVSTEFQAYQTAGQTFRDKYFAIPGDFKYATKFWNRLNTNADCVSNHGLTAAASPGACDGDGNGTINSPSALNKAGEMFGFWQHLANAGLIEGSYTGIAGGQGALDGELRSNIPASKMGNAGWSIRYLAGTGDVSMYAVTYGNAFVFGANTTDYETVGALLTPEEAWNIDTKMDDGKPAYGRVIARFWNNLCSVADDGTSTNNDLAASYKLTDTSARCALYFTNAF